MYSQTKKNGLILLTGLMLLAGCRVGQDEAIGQTSSEKHYYDLEAYFTGQADKLGQQDPEILKTVSNNGQSETKTLKIKNWKNELAPFLQSDINKDAWKGQYRVDSSDLSLIYTSKDPALRTQKISVEKTADGRINVIRIENEVNNSLYKSREQLSFYPDSLYEIRKQQDILVIGKNEYVITGNLRF